MIKNCKTLLLFVFILTLFSCGSDDNPDCSRVFPPPNWFELGFIDEQGQSLIGTVYQQDEFRIFNANSEAFIAPINGGDLTKLQVRFPDFESNTQYFIEFATEDIDTLNFIFETTQRPCFLTYDLKQVIYNGETFEVQNTNRIDLVK